MTALATSTDVVADLGRALTAAESAKVGAALDKASALVRAETGRFYEADTFTVRRKVSGGKVTLDDPTSVTTVTEVDCDGNATNLSGYTLRGATVYGLGCDRWVEVEYDCAGTIPAALVTVVAAMAGRSITASAPEGVESYTVTRGPFTESASYGATSDSVAATPSELAIIRRHRLRPGALNLL